MSKILPIHTNFNKKYVKKILPSAIAILSIISFSSLNTKCSKIEKDEFVHEQKDSLKNTPKLIIDESLDVVEDEIVWP